MAKHLIKVAASDPEMNEALRRVRKGVVSTLMTSAPRVRAAKWVQEKRSAGAAEK